MSNIKERLPQQLEETVVRKIISNEEVANILSAYIIGKGDSLPKDAKVSIEIALVYPESKGVEEAVVE